MEKLLPSSVLGQKSNCSGRNCIDAGERGQEPGLGVNNWREGPGLGVKRWGRGEPVLYEF